MDRASLGRRDDEAHTRGRDQPRRLRFPRPRRLRDRGEAPPENLEFKLISGDDVWWLNRRDFAFPKTWTTLTTKKRKIEFAWGPHRGEELRHVDAIEIVVTAGSGGKGTVWFSDPELGPLPPSDRKSTRPGTVVRFGEKRELGG